MSIVFKLLPDGGFVAGDTESRMTSYAYPTSPLAKVARHSPKTVAEEMLAREMPFFRVAPSILEYDQRNWIILGGAL